MACVKRTPLNTSKYKRSQRCGTCPRKNYDPIRSCTLQLRNIYKQNIQGKLTEVLSAGW